MQKVALSVATRGRLTRHITASQRVDAPRWACDHHPDPGLEVVVLAAFPGLIKTIAWQSWHIYFEPRVYYFNRFLVTQMYLSSRCCTDRLGSMFDFWEFLIVVTGRHPQRCKQQQHPPAAQSRSYKRPFQSGNFSFLLNNDTCVAPNTRPSSCLHIHASAGGGEGGVALFATCDSVPGRFEEWTELKMPSNDWNVEGRVTSSSKPTTRGWRVAPLNAGSCFYHLGSMRGKWE